MVMSSNNNQNNNNNNQSNNLDILDQIQNVTQEPNSMKECFKNEDVSVFYSITKKEGNNIDGSVFVSNNKQEKINELKINFLVQKFVKLTVLATSGNALEPGQSLGIKKDFTLTTSDPNKKIIIKIKLLYSINNEEKKHEITIKNL